MLSKRMLFWVFVFGILAGLLFFYLQPSRVTYSAMVKVGRIQGKLVEDIPEVIQRLRLKADKNQRNNVQADKFLQTSPEDFYNVYNIKDSDLLVIESKGRLYGEESDELAARHMIEHIMSVVSVHQEMFNSASLPAGGPHSAEEKCGESQHSVRTASHPTVKFGSNLSRETTLIQSRFVSCAVFVALAFIIIYSSAFLKGVLFSGQRSDAI